MKQFILFACLLACGINACSDENPTEATNTSIVENMALVHEASSSEFTMRMYANNENIHAGYNTFVFQVERAGLGVEVEELRVVPTMHMLSGMSHGTPAGYFEDTNERGLYRYGVLFSMPSETDTSWTMHVEALLTSGESVEFNFPIKVESGGNVVVRRKDGAKLIASLVDQGWQVGKQNFELYMFEDISHVYAPISYEKLEFYPWMGSMGHGSIGNEQPTEQRLGEYFGAVNFSMSGPWQMHFAIHEGTFAGDTLTFDVDVR